MATVSEARGKMKNPKEEKEIVLNGAQKVIAHVDKVLGSSPAWEKRAEREVTRERAPHLTKSQQGRQVSQAK